MRILFYQNYFYENVNVYVLRTTKPMEFVEYLMDLLSI